MGFRSKIRGVVAKNRNAPQSEIAEHFHESTKFTRANIVKLGLRVGAYVKLPMFLEEQGNNRKPYVLNARKQLPIADFPDASLKTVLRQRRTALALGEGAVELGELAALLHTALGVTKTALQELKPNLPIRFRAYPSGGALYPVEAYVVALRVSGLSAGCYYFDATSNSLVAIGNANDVNVRFQHALLDDGRRIANSAALAILLTAVMPRSFAKYGAKGYRFALLEAGHAGQNILLAASALDLDAVPWSGYFDDELAALLGVDVVNEPVVHSILLGRGTEK